MARRQNKSLLLFQKVKNYQDWLKLIRIWKYFSNLPKERQGPALDLSLEDEALDALDARLELGETDFFFNWLRLNWHYKAQSYKKNKFKKIKK